MERVSFNLCNLPPWVVASQHFNEAPQPIELQGVRQANRFLFGKLDTLACAEARAHAFHDYVSVKFQLHHWEEQPSAPARRSIRNSYLRYLRGWGVDSSSLEGAVLKGWVESRFGVTPTFHRTRIDGLGDEGYFFYVRDRMKGSERTNAIHSQLDLLYEFTQYELERRMPGERWLTLWRGVHGEEEERVLERHGRELLVRLNNLSSFTDDAERAWEFGHAVWEARVPRVKVFYFSGLLPTSLLRGEREFLVLGGDCRVRRRVG